MTSPFLRPNNTQTGPTGINCTGSGRVMAMPPQWPRNRPFPWPYPGSATQGAVGGAGGIGKVSVPNVPWYQPYHMYFPYAIPEQYFRGYPNIPLRMH